MKKKSIYITQVGSRLQVFTHADTSPRITFRKRMQREKEKNETAFSRVFSHKAHFIFRVKN